MTGVLVAALLGIVAVVWVFVTCIAFVCVWAFLDEGRPLAVLAALVVAGIGIAPLFYGGA